MLDNQSSNHRQQLDSHVSRVSQLQATVDSHLENLRLEKNSKQELITKVESRIQKIIFFNYEIYGLISFFYFLLIM
jgi:hypothetical protein